MRGQELHLLYSPTGVVSTTSPLTNNIMIGTITKQWLTFELLYRTHKVLATRIYNQLDHDSRDA
jgi:hypothetical protein